MDAKPQRPRIRTLRDENHLPFSFAAKPTSALHGRHKSSPNLLAMAKSSVFGLNSSNPNAGVVMPTTTAAAPAPVIRRTAFADLSNNVRSGNAVRDDASVGVKAPVASIRPVVELDTKAVASIEPVIELDTKPAGAAAAPALDRPPQRPASLAGLRSVLGSFLPTVQSSSARQAAQIAVTQNQNTTETSSSAAPLVRPATSAGTVALPKKSITRKATKVFRETSLPNTHVDPAPAPPPAPVSVPTLAPTLAVPLPPAPTPQVSVPTVVPYLDDFACEALPPLPESSPAEFFDVLDEIDSADLLIGPAPSLLKDVSEEIRAALESEMPSFDTIAPALPTSVPAISTSVEMVAPAPPPHIHTTVPSYAPLLTHEIDQFDYVDDEIVDDDLQYYSYYLDDHSTARSLKSRTCVSAVECTTTTTTTTTATNILAQTCILAPRLTARDAVELEDAREFVERCPETVELEEDEAWDTSMVAEYGADIFAYMHELEEKMRPDPFYMENQTEVQWSMRSVLMDWIVQVHHRFGLTPETLFLTVNYIDRFLSHKVVSLGKLQLVGATALFVAAKYEEITCPSVQEIVYMVDGGYTVDEVLKAERYMLTMLQFELGWPGPLSFLRRISKADDYDLETRTLAKYFLEVTLMDERFVGTIPSYAAAGAHCLARRMLRKDNLEAAWSPKHVHYSGYTYAQLRPLLTALLSCCKDPGRHHAAVYDKYTDKRFKCASAFVAAQIGKGALVI